GVQLALDQQNASGHKYQLVIVDDSGVVARDAVLAHALEQRGVIAIIGPLRSEGVEGAATARRDSLLAIISPTASSIRKLRNTYSLNEEDVEAAATLASYARSAGLTHVATLYLRSSDVARQAHVFADRARTLGLTVIGEMPYDSGTTTFAKQIKAL